MLQFNEFYEIRLEEDNKAALDKLGISNPKPSWKQILGFSPDAKPTFQDAFKKYKEKMLQFNPNIPDNQDVATLLNHIYEKLKELEQKKKQEKQQQKDEPKSGLIGGGTYGTHYRGDAKYGKLDPYK